MTAPELSTPRRLLALVEDAGTRGVSAAEVSTALGVERNELADLLRRMLAKDHAWLDPERRRLYSTAPI